MSVSKSITYSEAIYRTGGKPNRHLVCQALIAGISSNLFAIAVKPPEPLLAMAKKSKSKKSKKISKKDIRNEETDKLCLTLINYKVGNSKRKFRRTLKKVVKIITQIAVKTAKKLGHK